MPEKDLITQNLRALKDIEALTEKEFAERIGNVPRHNINKYLSRSIPPPEVIRAISKAFNIDIHKLFCTELTRANYDEFKLDSHKPEQEDLKIEAVQSIKKCLETVLDNTAEEVLKREASEKLIEETGAVIASALEFYELRDKLYHYLQKEQLVKNKT